MKRQAISIFFIIASMGFMISLLAHVSTLLGVNPEREFLYLWIMIIGLFAAWNPTKLITNNLVDEKNIREFWTLAMKNASGWIKLLYIFLTGYASLNLLYFAVLKHETYELRAVTSYSLVFYLVAATVLYAKMKEEDC